MHKRAPISCIYEIACKANGRVYIGSTQDFRLRMIDHRKLLRHGKHTSRHLQAAFTKYGEAEFTFSILLECAVENLRLLEQAAMDMQRVFGGRESLFNHSLRADRPDWSDESRALLRSKRLGKLNPFFGKKHSAEACASMAASRTGRTTWNKGIKATPECRAKISAANRLRTHSAETRSKMSTSNKRLKAEGRTWAAEHRANHAAGQQRRRARSRAEKVSAT
jgi:group I intron endonuclease